MVGNLARPLSGSLRLAATLLWRRVARWSVPHYTRWGLYLQAIFIVIALFWFELRPDCSIQGPSVAMAFLAVAAVIMAVRGPDSTRIEGVVWVLISFSLFALEMHSIRVDRETHDAEQSEIRRAEENRQQQQVRSFTKLIGDGQRLFAAFGEEKQLTTENLEHITGGNGYCWIVPFTPLSVAEGGDPAHQGANWQQIGLKNSGSLVLPTCDIQLVPYPTVEEAQQGKIPQDIFYHFEKVPVLLDYRHYNSTPYFITNDRTYSGTIKTPTRTFTEVIEFKTDPTNASRSVPTCVVQEFPELSSQGKALRPGRVLETECFPQKFRLQKPK
jgi:hypothetical protein